MANFDPRQQRDNHGMWTSEGGINAMASNDLKDAIRKAASDINNVALIESQRNMQNVGNLVKDAENSTDEHFGTNVFYMDAQTGNYTNERLNIQADIVRQYISRGSTYKGTSYFLGGPPASGKSSIEGLVNYPDGILRVDPDAIKTMFPEYPILKSAQYAKTAALLHEESSKVSKDILAKASQSRMDVVIDTVGDGKYEKLAQKVFQQRQSGKRVEANYITVDTEEGIRRANVRGNKPGGRKVPEEYQRKMHKEISSLFPKLVENRLFDKLTLWDNNGSKPKKIFEQDGRKVNVIDENAYQKFLNKSK